jgi:DNA-binding CsgD family transcriptional regulator
VESVTALTAFEVTAGGWGARMRHMVLLEREHALNSLAEYAQSAAGGDGRVVLIAGEAGIGKTALVDALCAQMEDLPWLRGACDGLFIPRPLGPLVDIGERVGGELAAALGGGEPREKVFDAMLRLLQHHPTGVVVEDAHWADEATLDLIAFLGRRVRQTKALLIVTYRDDALSPSHPLRVVLGELASTGSARRITVPPLSERAVATLSASAELDPDAVFRLTGGNAFLVTELVASGGTDVPESARALVQARIARLSTQARGAVEAAALLGSTVEPDIVCAVAGAGAADLDELLGAGVLTSDGGRLQFRHELTRLAVAQDVPAHRSAAIHRTALTVLSAANHGGEYARLAYHAEGAGDGATVLRVAPLAAREAAALASHRESAAQYERALRFADRADAATRAALYTGLEQEYALIDRFADAADAGVVALDLHREIGDVSAAGDMQRRLAHAMWRLCRGPEAVEYARAAVATLEPSGPSEPLAAAYAMLAYQVGDITYATRAQDVAAQLNLPGLLSNALNTEAWLHAHRDEPWFETMQRALQVAVAAGAVTQGGRAYANTHTILVKQRRLSESDEYFRDGLAYCERNDLPTWTTCLRGWRSIALEMWGQWDNAVAICTETLQTIASPVNRLTSLVSLGLIRARRADPTSWECLDEARANALGTAETDWIAMVGLARAEAHWLGGDEAAAGRELSALSDAVEHADGFTRGAWAVWQRRAGQPARAASGVLAEPYALTLAGGPSAVAAWERLGCRYEAALASLDIGDEPSARSALTRFESLGASAAARRARRRLRQLGVRSVPAGAQSATREHPRGLTRREQQILELISAGLTNAQICTQLVISERTVDHHVSAVLRKLGVSTRSAAAAEAARLELAGSSEK